ncbi:hypothetical protein C8Q78DRAFT_1077972 [Trametes maxima]|nr:hypothetical protein C8Q78DRAFT_1077972 [Trametes maxima]
MSRRHHHSHSRLRRKPASRAGVEALPQHPVDILLDQMARGEHAGTRLSQQRWARAPVKFTFSVTRLSRYPGSVRTTVEETLQLHLNIKATLPDNTVTAHNGVLDLFWPHSGPVIPRWYSEMRTDGRGDLTYKFSMGWLDSLARRILRHRSLQLPGAAYAPWWEVVSFVEQFKEEHKDIREQQRHPEDAPPVREPSQEV